MELSINDIFTNIVGGFNYKVISIIGDTIIGTRIENDKVIEKSFPKNEVIKVELNPMEFDLGNGQKVFRG